ncbi:ankyrin [Rhizoclosmatium globosum]|uniref:Osteoclast-stimulating factor 1 n=1 Tax=Rhizoclosmatium globosum TaxID=329046 RepID=A0A1Y2CNW5_9FUNG|nr:ankyrin [Rhizoclosmatium globosum]|eukprot:ORY48730.1 ankyrin [Rhizoclosmatium globosum]
MAAPPPRPTRPGKKEIAVVEAKFAYTAQNPDELSFEEGDILYVLQKDDAGWWKCRSGDKEGLVPANYVGESTVEIENPMHEAAKRGNVAFLAELLAAGVSVNGLDRAGNSPLHWAARAGKTDVVRMLLEQKPAINSKNKLGDTPLHNAAWGGHLAVVTLLLSQPDIQVNIKNNDGATPQSLSKSDDVAALLIQFGNSSSGAGAVGGEDEDSD